MVFALTSWQDPPTHPVLSEDEVHLWRFPLACREPLQNLLDAGEIQRAQRLRSPVKARAFITARARLRQILSGYLDLPPASLRFDYGPAGKPVLVSQGADGPAFNLAHSGAWGLCAVVKVGEVGVDIEQIDARLDFEPIAAAFFSPQEYDRLMACTAARRRRIFYRLWTRKEAWLKGRGIGFSDNSQELAPPHLEGCCTHDGHWWLRSFPVARHYLAALAVPHRVKRLRCWEGWPAANGDLPS